MQLKDSNSKPNTANAVDTIQGWIINQIAKQLGINAQTIKVTEPLTRYGLDSIDSVTIVGELEDWLSAELPPTLLWDYPTIEKAANYLVNELGISPAQTSATEAPAVNNKPQEAPKEKAWGGLWNKISGS
ncbi:acyl carrier protein [Nostoc sp. TCL26-01]|uniref:acyl carrier protein n=1 Tax=Nostoc sp. TCL26-01 TaxID=2576904 RepID=UPI0015BD403B|nr:acyl carrier protein [Nostoc sp. TCL26-01]QLE56268.1 phosphopantetheine-binding protein [Nostoc sp. TCL26-01]